MKNKLNSFRRFLFLFFLSILGQFLIACSADSPTSPPPNYGVDIVKAKPEQSLTNILEGETATITVKLERKLVIQGYITWEIKGGVGRFARPTGVQLMPVGSNTVSLSFETYKNEIIEAPTEFEVALSSESFYEPTSFLIRVTDTTQPAQLLFTQESPFQFPTTAINQAIRSTFILQNYGEVPASSITVASLPLPFRFAGGSYPGLEGTCGGLIKSGESCTLSLESFMTDPGAATGQMQVTYFNGNSNQILNMDLKAASDSVVAVLAGLPNSLSNSKTLGVTVSGVGVTKYKAKVGPNATTDCADGSNYLGEVSIAVPITTSIAALADGKIRLCVVAYNGSNWQSYPGATFFSWIKDTEPPANGSIKINNAQAATNSMDVNLTLKADGAQFMLVSNVTNCHTEDGWEIYDEAKSWSLNFPNQVNRIYVKYRDMIGNVSTCYYADIKHDNIPPQLGLDQDSNQADPTIITPVAFVLTVNEPLDPTILTPTGCINTEVIEQKGTARGIRWSCEVVQNNPAGMILNLAAVSIDIGGTIIPEIKANQLRDVAGNYSIYTSTIDNSVTYNIQEFYMKSLFLGDNYSCGISYGGQTYCWGDNSEGQLGTGIGNPAPAYQRKPTLVDTTNEASGYRKIVPGYRTTCGFANSGKAMCWGRNLEGQAALAVYVAPYFSDLHENFYLPTSVNYYHGVVGTYGTDATPSSDGDLIDVTVGKFHSCFLTQSGSVLCVGDFPANGQLGRVTSGVYNSGGITLLDHILQDGFRISQTYFGSKDVVKITGGYDHNCVLNSAGKIYCWGRGNFGQMGNSSTADVMNPSPINTANVTPYEGFVDLSGGSEHTCALTPKGEAFCWGKGTSGQLGNAASVNATIPVKVDVSSIINFKGFAEIKSGRNHVCARTVDGKIYCWGDSTNGKLGADYADALQSSPVPVMLGSNPLTNVISLAVGANHACVIKADGQTLCWGEQGNEGRLGNNSTTSSMTPQPLEVSDLIGKRAFRSLSSGSKHTCGVNTQGKVLCWGKGNDGQLGSGSNTNLTAPNEVNMASVQSGAFFVQVSSGNVHSCAITIDGNAYCWGKNNEGQLGLGLGNKSDKLSPTIVDTSGISSFMGFKQISAGDLHTCALQYDGKMFCWGYGNFGQLGRNSLFSSTIPVEVVIGGIAGLSRFLSMDAGSFHNCAIGAVGTNRKAYCWGYGSLGRIGNNQTSDVLVPVAVNTDDLPTTANPMSISAGGENTCANFSGASRAWCWGNGLNGRLGNRDPLMLTRRTPSRVDISQNLGSDSRPLIWNFSQIETGKDHTCALTNRNQVFCWGEGSEGQLGDNYGLYRVGPTSPIFNPIFKFLGAISITSGAGFTCTAGVSSDSYCWGQGVEGQMGNGYTDSKLVPARLLYP